MTDRFKSRWLVGSSKSKTFGFKSIVAQEQTHRFTPDKTFVALNGSSLVKSNRPNRPRNCSSFASSFHCHNHRCAFHLIFRSFLHDLGACNRFGFHIPIQRPVIRPEFPKEQAKHACLSRPVSTDDCDLFTPKKPEMEVFANHGVLELFREAIHRKNLFSARSLNVEAYERPLNIGPFQIG